MRNISPRAGGIIPVQPKISLTTRPITVASSGKVAFRARLRNNNNSTVEFWGATIPVAFKSDNPQVGSFTITLSESKLNDEFTTESHIFDANTLVLHTYRKHQALYITPVTIAPGASLELFDVTLSWDVSQQTTISCELLRKPINDPIRGLSLVNQGPYVVISEPGFIQASMTRRTGLWNFSTDCCQRGGDANHDGSTDIGDVTQLIAHFF